MRNNRKIESGNLFDLELGMRWYSSHSLSSLIRNVFQEKRIFQHKLSFLMAQSH